MNTDQRSPYRNARTAQERQEALQQAAQELALELDPETLRALQQPSWFTLEDNSHAGRNHRTLVEECET